MKIWDFEPLLREWLAADPRIAKAESFAASGVAYLYGVVAHSSSGGQLLIRLTRGSGPIDDLTNPPQEHRDNVAHVAGMDPVELKPLGRDEGPRVEQLLRAAIERAGHPDVLMVQTTAERRPKETGVAPGLVVICRDDTSEIYISFGR